MSLLIRLLRDRRRTIAVILALSVIEAAPIVVTGEFFARALDRGFLPGRLASGFWWLAALLGAIVLGAAASRIIQPRLSTVVEPLGDDLVRIVVDASLRDSRQRAAVDRVETVRRSVSALLWTLRQSGIAIIATIAGICLLSPILVLFVVPPVLIAVVVFWLLLPRLIDRRRAVALADEAVARDSAGLLHGLRDVIACQAADRAAADMAVVIDRRASAARDLARLSALRALIVAFGAQVPLVVLIGFGPRLIHSGRLSTGALLAAAGYLVVALQPALRSFIRTAGNWIPQLAVAASRIAESTALPAESLPGEATPPGYALQFSNVTFAYGRDADPVFRDLDLAVAEGEHLAVIGPSVTGKSTLADLMCGLIRPRRGDIRLDGVPLESWDPARLHSRVALVPRDAYVFAGTVTENVGYLSSGARLVAAADAVDLWSLLDRLGGWDAEISRASLGPADRQLIALARAYASPARLVILDEATCHLDQERESFIEESFRDRAGTLIVIAHGLDSARRADRILVLDGRSAVEGRYEDLVDTRPVVANREPVHSR
jgi:ABC-type multidrug transport system fused ATPase/permease subunit